MIEVDVKNMQRKRPLNRRRMAELAAAALRTAGYERAQLSLVVVNDRRMRDLNRIYRGRKGTTDVLAFPMAVEPVLQGEILVSADTARREAARRGHSAYHELLLYAVHGVMHLLGYDDHDAAGRRRMRRAERAALAALGVGPVFGRSAGGETRGGPRGRGR